MNTDCPSCRTSWDAESEQANAIRIRGKCIVCILDAAETIQSDPYEFALSDIAKQRGSFESWMQANSTACLNRDVAGYSVYEVDLAWRSWQAACEYMKETT